jgi:lincosamide nucleotidyltransferase A/C/D/E
VSDHHATTPVERRAGGVGLTSGKDVIAILGALEMAAVPASVGGGWGVDALVGAQTRPHADLDLLIPAEQSETATEVLGSLGFVLTLDLRPTRFVLTRPDGAEVDLHPVRFLPDRSARLPGFDGVDFVLPAGCLDAIGTIEGHPVRCLTVGQQLTAHSGYDPTEHDLLDMELLNRLTHSG